MRRVGESVRVADGPYVGFVGTIERIGPNGGKFRLLLHAFGRSLLVELDVARVETL